MFCITEDLPGLARLNADSFAHILSTVILWIMFVAKEIFVNFISKHMIMHWTYLLLLLLSVYWISLAYLGTFGDRLSNSQIHISILFTVQIFNCRLNFIIPVKIMRRKHKTLINFCRCCFRFLFENAQAIIVHGFFQNFWVEPHICVMHRRLSLFLIEPAKNAWETFFIYQKGGSVDRATTYFICDHRSNASL